MASTGQAIGRAAEIGREHRAAFAREFGEDPVVGRVGDWDATSWGEAWREIERPFDPTDPEHHDHYHGARLAYLRALFATEDVG